MASVIAAAGYRVIASDIADWGYGATGWDFLAAVLWLRALWALGLAVAVLAVVYGALVVL